MRNRDKFKRIRKYIYNSYKEVPLELIYEDDFLIYLEFLITCLDYDLRPNKEELEQLREDIINYILNY